MLLAVDVGNTQTVIGVFEEPTPSPVPGDRPPGTLPGLLRSWRAATAASRTADEHALLLRQLLELAGIALPLAGGELPRPGMRAVEGIIVSSSVPAVTATVREMAARWLEVPLVVVGPGIRTGMPVLYDNPKEVGPDRIVNAVGAHDLYGAPAIVVDLGTATTFDVLSPAGEYLGGAIVPGLEISMDALFGHAAALPRIALGEPRRAIGRSTAESMLAGAVYGHAALIDGMCERIGEELGPCTTIATGGLASVVVPHARRIEHVEPWLTLHGLRLLWARNQEEHAQ